MGVVDVKVLVVEDNEDSRNLLMKQLRAYGHEVTATANGAEALEQALAQPPDIIVSDILMPKMDGYQLCYEWKQNDRLRDIPFIFYTATYTSDEDEKFALSLGANTFIRKPAEPDAFVQILSQVFEKAKSGLLPPPEVAPLEPSLYLTEYNKRLVTKLDEKVAQLEADITERKQVEEKLREGEKKYKLLFESTLDGMFVLDAETMKVVLANQAAADIYGFNSVEEAIGVVLLDFVPPEEREQVLRIIVKDMFENDLRKVNEFRTITKDGREIWISAVGTRTEYQGKLAGLISFSDITERKQAEEALIITGRLASVGELASGIAHELNNPLTGVIGFAQMVLDKDIPDDIKRDIEVVYSEAQRAAQVVKNLLTFARKHAPAKQLVSINSTIEKVLELRAYEQRVSNIQVKTQFAPDLPQVMADYFQLQQVFLNIIINAEHFMIEAHNGGNLTITTERAGDIIKASFTDDGPGIAEENLGHLFDPFFTTKEVGKGTGLGLSICHGIIAEHGGRIYAESELGKGATFIVELPIGAH